MKKEQLMENQDVGVKIFEMKRKNESRFISYIIMKLEKIFRKS